MTRPISVPGKLFLLGEYAVLAGGPALLTTSLDRQVRVRAGDEGAGYRLLGADFADPQALPAMVLEELGLDPSAIEGLEVDLREFYADTGEKLGLGSSAASAVALVRALGPELETAAVAEAALRAHRRFQGGHGSGADVVACAWSRPVVVRVEALDPAFARISLQGHYSGPLVEAVALPEGLQAWGLWTGASASTTSFMGPVRELAGKAPEELRQYLEEIAAIAAAGIDACQRDRRDAFLEALARGDQAMEELGARCDLPIITARHRQLRGEAAAAGFVAKPSGAGGGDFSLLVGPAEAPLPPFANDALRVALHAG